jgi:hypothetical protein
VTVIHALLFGLHSGSVIITSLKDILRTEGFKGLYRGLSSTLVALLLLMIFFGPVTWHHQRRPLRPRLGLQNKKGPPGVGRRSLLLRSSQSSVCKERREREGERARENNRFCPNDFLYSLLYPCMLYVHFAPVKHKAQWRRLISSLT